jgi:hypothetical protein
MKHNIIIIAALAGIFMSVNVFAAGNYSINVIDTAGGTISPSGSPFEEVTLEAGASQEFQINASLGYLISDVIVDGVSVGAVSSYTFNNVSADHSISATFQLDATACGSLITQDFNEGQVPPSGWQLLSTNLSVTWEPLSISTGDSAAAVDWDTLPQDEVLLSQELSTKEAILHFWSKGDPFWCRDDNDLCDLEIWIVVGTWDGGSGDDIFVGKAEDDWIESFSFAPSSFTLTPMLPDKPIRIGFRYKGDDGDLIALDNVQICSGKPAVTSLPFLFLLLE